MTPEKVETIYYDEEPSRARELLESIAANGNVVAQLYMGHLCDEEYPPNQSTALDWYRKSADGGFLEGIHYLASFTYHGFGTSQDVDEAIRLFRISAEAGLDASQWKLGQHFLSHPQHRAEAIRWLTLAADQGHEAAKKLLSNA